MKYFICLILVISFYNYKLIAQPNAIIKSSNTKYIIHGIDKVEISKEYEILINDKEGLQFSRFIDYTDKFKKVKQLEVTIYDKNGKKVKKLGRDDALDVKFSNSYEIDDSRILVLFPDYKQYPYSVKVFTKSVYNGFISLPTWLPRFEYDLEVEKATLELEFPTDYKIDLLEEHISNKGVEQIKGTKVIKWEVLDLAAVGKEINRTTFINNQPKVLISPMNFELEGAKGSYESWESFGNWFVELNSGRDGLLPDTKVFLDGLRPLEKYDLIREIYHFMQDKTRYISIQLGIGGFQTIPSDEVEITGYGDCKALTNYMKSMLEYVGIPSNYILVRAGENVPDVKAEFPSNQFNHLFLGIPSENDTILLECTSQLLPMNYTGNFTDDRNVLWIEPSGSKIIRSRIYDEASNSKNTIGIINIDDNGNAQMSIQTTNSGVFYSELMRYKHVSHEDAIQYHYEKFNYDDFKINDFSFSEMHRDSTDFNLEFNLVVKNLAKKSSDKLLIPLNMWFSIDKELNIKSISSSVDIKRGFRIHDEFEVFVPKSYWLKNPLKNMKLESKFGEYSISVEFIDEKYIIKRDALIQKGFYEGESFKEFNQFIKKIKRADNSKIVLDSKT